tara:strand:- start:4043 stop:5263 length:1221 start_codon:yes stop_codon:yes gene_type:complete
MPLSKITAASITDNSVTTAKVADDAITGAKIENNPTIAGNLTVSGGFIPSTSLSTRNIIINGDMSVAQRGTSSTSSNFQTVDRMSVGYGTISVTQSQQSLTSGSPYEAGFNNFIRMANTSTSSAAGAYVQLYHPIEAQHIANSGWNFKSSSSFITLSFWARSSLAGTYYARVNTDDGTAYYRIKAFTLSADTWTKVTFTIEGNSNLTINNDNGLGFQVVIIPHYGTTFTGSNASTTAWFTLVSNDYFPDFAQNWSNTSSATFDVTGMQLEVGEVATPFKHESFGDNLQRCQRYFAKSYSIGTAPAENAEIGFTYTAVSLSGTDVRVPFVTFPVRMRAAPTVQFDEPAYPLTGGSANQWHYGGVEQYDTPSTSISKDNGFYCSATVAGGSTSNAYWTSGEWTANAEI